jgi:hypothetical protein
MEIEEVEYNFVATRKEFDYEKGKYTEVTRHSVYKRVVIDANTSSICGIMFPAIPLLSIPDTEGTQRGTFGLYSQPVQECWMRPEGIENFHSLKRILSEAGEKNGTTYTAHWTRADHLKIEDDRTRNTVFLLYNMPWTSAYLADTPLKRGRELECWTLSDVLFLLKKSLGLDAIHEGSKYTVNWQAQDDGYVRKI